MCKNNFCKKRFFILPLIVGGLFAVSAVVMLLWNHLIPVIFTSVTAITYWQAMGLFILSHILFGKGPGGHHHRRHRYHLDHEAYHEKFMNLTDEEKEQFKDNMKRRCCN